MSILHTPLVNSLNHSRSFSDNDTATQPLYGQIAADAGKRQRFANNVVHFMQQYGFDGLDIDWEYPAAPDRYSSPPCIPALAPRGSTHVNSTTEEETPRTPGTLSCCSRH